MANCFQPIFSKHFHEKHEFGLISSLTKFYADKAFFSNRKVIKALEHAENLTDAHTSTFNHLTRFFRTLSKESLIRFLRFATGGDILPDNSISVQFAEHIPRAPRSRTCVPMIEMSETYDCYNSLSEEFINILNNPDSFSFSFI